MPRSGTVHYLPGSDPDVSVRIERAAAALGVELLGAEPGVGGTARLGDLDLDPSAPDWLLDAALLRALAPDHILFLCVANSARSQLAEGIARALAPPSVKISSAGSEPGTVRPQAVEVLAEVGIDISHHVSSGIDEVERPVDAVVTLCAEEVCPAWLGDAWRVHWGLPDPAAAGGTGADRLEAFREVRDLLRERLAVLFGSFGR
jgi:arsenate reductase